MDLRKEFLWNYQMKGIVNYTSDLLKLSQRDTNISYQHSASIERANQFIYPFGIGLPAADGNNEKNTFKREPDGIHSHLEI